MKILIVEDDQIFLESLVEELEKTMIVETCNNADKAEFMINANSYDLLILDVGIEPINGIELCKIIRSQKHQIPIIMLTAETAVSFKTESLDIGADDYVCKPFDIEELKSRIRAVSRRNWENSYSNIIRVGELQLNTKQQTLKRKNQLIVLNHKLYLIIELFMRHPNQTLSRNQILENVWGSVPDYFTKTVDVHIKYLRDKIERPFNSRVIKTIRGSGYQLIKNPKMYISYPKHRKLYISERR